MNAVRLFWAFHKVSLGLLFAGAIIVVLMLAMGGYGPGQDAIGRVTAFEIAGGVRSGPYAAAVVRVDGRFAKIRLWPSITCEVGSEVALVRRRTLLGERYAAALRPDACRPGASAPPELEKRGR